jgi:hypothetical protein
MTVGNIWGCRVHLPGNPSKNWGRGHLVRGAGRSAIDEEISEAYKDVEGVVEVAHRGRDFQKGGQAEAHGSH